MEFFLPIVQIIISIFLIAAILLQQRGTGLGAAFGGSDGFYATRRGIQNKLLWATIVFGTIFIILALLNLVF